MAGDVCWGLRGVWGRDRQDETATGGGVISSTAVGRREVLSRHRGAAELDVPFPNTPCPGGAVLTPPRIPGSCARVRLGMRLPAQPMAR